MSKKDAQHEGRAALQWQVDRVESGRCPMRAEIVPFDGWPFPDTAAPLRGSRGKEAKLLKGNQNSLLFHVIGERPRYVETVAPQDFANRGCPDEQQELACGFLVLR
jgi:hypothetical protein